MKTFSSKLEFMSNFYPARVEVDGACYQSAGTVFQAQRRLDTVDRKPRWRGMAKCLAAIVAVAMSLPSLGSAHEHGCSTTRQEALNAIRSDAGTVTNRSKSVQVPVSSSCGEPFNIPTPEGFTFIEDGSALVHLLREDAAKDMKLLGNWISIGDHGMKLAIASMPAITVDKRVSLTDFQKLRDAVKKEIQLSMKKGGATEEEAMSTDTVQMFPVHLEEMRRMGFTFVQKDVEDGETSYSVTSRAVVLIRSTLFYLDVIYVVDDEKEIDKTIAETRAALKDWLDRLDLANPGVRSSLTDSLDPASAMQEFAKGGNGGISHGTPLGTDNSGDRGARIGSRVLIGGIAGAIWGLISACCKGRKRRRRRYYDDYDD